MRSFVWKIEVWFCFTSKVSSLLDVDAVLWRISDNFLIHVWLWDMLGYVKWVCLEDRLILNLHYILLLCVALLVPQLIVDFITAWRSTIRQSFCLDCTLVHLLSWNTRYYFIWLLRIVDLIVWWRSLTTEDVFDIFIFCTIIDLPSLIHLVIVITNQSLLCGFAIECESIVLGEGLSLCNFTFIASCSNQILIWMLCSLSDILGGSSKCF